MARLQHFEHAGTHRLLAAKCVADSTLEGLALPPHVLADLSELDAATNERKLAQCGANSAIGPGELLLGVPEAHIVNAAFSHPGPYGGRFHSPRRGAWYARVEIETSFAEVAFHKRRFLADARIKGRHAFNYVGFLADFAGRFHTLDVAEREECLQPSPVPQCYQASQAVANKLLFKGSNGIVYPSVRQPTAICIACFRPALIFHPRLGHTYRIAVEWETDTVDTEVLPA